MENKKNRLAWLSGEREIESSKEGEKWKRDSRVSVEEEEEGKKTVEQNRLQIKEGGSRWRKVEDPKM